MRTTRKGRARWIAWRGKSGWLAAKKKRGRVVELQVRLAADERRRRRRKRQKMTGSF